MIILVLLTAVFEELIQAGNGFAVAAWTISHGHGMISKKGLEALEAAIIMCRLYICRGFFNLAVFHIYRHIFSF